jgi:hypothetical protein
MYILYHILYKMDLETNVSAKIAYLLSTCYRFNNAFMSSMIRQYEDTNTVAGRHHFSFHISLHEPIDANTKPGDFEVEGTSFNFLESNSLIMASVIQMSNNKILTENEMQQINIGLQQKNILIDIHHITGVYAVASLLKLYQNQYKNIFIPVVLDYGRTHNLVHQCAIIVDTTNGILMFYEPYGKYKKYGKSYEKCIKDFLHIFTPVLESRFFYHGELNYKTFHQHIGVSDGIQQIMLNMNNSHRGEFEQNYKQLIQEVNAEFPNNQFEPTSSSPDPSDHTMIVLDLLCNMDRTSIDKIPSNKKEKYKELLNRAMEYYYQYNSKTCVSITIVELNEYFKLVQSETPVVAGMKKYYSKFNKDEPNKELMTQIYSMINIFNNTKLIKKMLVDNVNSFQICNFLN